MVLECWTMTFHPRIAQDFDLPQHQRHLQNTLNLDSQVQYGQLHAKVAKCCLKYAFQIEKKDGCAWVPSLSSRRRS